ncbi:carbonic anhydrase 1-like [Cloeon dipterum]|uniref:carbonic anhydrase 1-like n=1 Tax=Cloeon dipterum TaxID=197152 RepID=UPI0032207779
MHSALLLIFTTLWFKARGHVMIDPELGVDPDSRQPYVSQTSNISSFASGLYCSNGTRQSPININFCVRSTMTALRTEGHSINRSEGFTMINTGTTAQINFGGSAPLLYGGPLPTGSSYDLVQAHFHWGPTDTQGSEHAQFGNYGPLEIHFVHKKSTYADLTAAIAQTDGLAVFGVIFALQNSDNPKLDKIINQLTSIPNPSSSAATLDSDAMVWLDDVLSTFRYYNYPGSLTTHDCNEVVNWIVMHKTIGISAAQVDKFRTLVNADGDTIPEARRAVQNLNDRVITCARGCLATPAPESIP